MDVNYSGTHADSVQGVINFAADPNDGGEFSNLTPERSSQKLQARDVTIRNGRIWPQQPTLEKEGLTLAAHPAGDADFANLDWVNNVYAPSCEVLVKKLFGVKLAPQIFFPLQRRVDYGNHVGAAPNAAFIHLDFTLKDAIREVTECLTPLGLTYRRAVVVNVWKAITPPPQDYPLAVADRNLIPASNHVVGKTVEFLGENKDRRRESPYTMLAPSDPILYYYPDMTIDESLVFIGLDLDPANPLGCAHTAFLDPSPSGPPNPRGSIEARFIAIYE